MSEFGIPVSVVIPALNEEATIGRALECTRLPGVERIVVDGGSTDATREVAHALGADRVLRSRPGRAQQLDLGFRAASGDAILFLHADTRLESCWFEALQRALARPEVAGGAFRLKFESNRSIYRLIEAAVRLRCALGKLPYGDQGLFLRRKLLDENHGVLCVPIFEDLDLVRLIRCSGRLALLESRAWTSARRYERNGVLLTLLYNSVALLTYLLDLDREAVARWYQRRLSP